MKKILALIAAIAMIFSLGVVLTACGGDSDDNGYTTTTEDTTYENGDTTEPNGDTTYENGATTEPSETTTAAEATTEVEDIDPNLPPANLNQLSQAEQLAYFNRVVNRVRTERPGHMEVQTLRIDDVRFTGAAALIRPVVNLVIGIIMPGDPENRPRTRGQDNQYYWMSDVPGANMAANLRTQDITSITSTRQGNNWRIEVRIRQEVNPVPRTGPHNRILPIQTREQIIAEITGAGPISADPNDATVTFHSGFAWVVVNPQGQVIEAAGGYDVTAEARARIAGINTNVTAQQSSRWVYSNFGW